MAFCKKHILQSRREAFHINRTKIIGLAAAETEVRDQEKPNSLREVTGRRRWSEKVAIKLRWGRFQINSG